MSSQKIRAAAKRWTFKWETPVDRMTPEQINFRIQSAYMDGFERGRRDQRTTEKRRKSSRGNTNVVADCKNPERCARVRGGCERLVMCPNVGERIGED